MNASQLFTALVAQAARIDKLEDEIRNLKKVIDSMKADINSPRKMYKGR